MSETEEKNGAGQKSESFDRQGYLKKVRQELLKNLGLPPETKPENVARLLEIKTKMKQGGH